MDELHQGAELAEATMMAQFALQAPAEIKAARGIALTRIAGATILSTREDPTGYWSKAVGFVEPVNEQLIGEVIDFYRSEGNARAVIQVPPWAMPDDWSEIASKHRLSQGTSIVKLIRRVDEIAPASTELRIGEIDPSQAEEWAKTVLEGFGMSGLDLEQIVARFGNLEGHHMYAAWDGDRMVAGGALTIHKSVGYGSTAATLPQYRGKGAQSALIALGDRAAQEKGCQWSVTDTGMPADGDTSNPSYNNLRRSGFDILYQRRNWIWTA